MTQRNGILPGFRPRRRPWTSARPSLPGFGALREDALQDLQHRLLELEDTLIPEGLHVVGEPLGEAGRANFSRR